MSLVNAVNTTHELMTELITGTVVVIKAYISTVWIATMIKKPNGVFQLNGILRKEKSSVKKIWNHFCRKKKSTLYGSHTPIIMVEQMNHRPNDRRSDWWLSSGAEISRIQVKWFWIGKIALIRISFRLYQIICQMKLIPKMNLIPMKRYWEKTSSHQNSKLTFLHVLLVFFDWFHHIWNFPNDYDKIFYWQ